MPEIKRWEPTLYPLRPSANGLYVEFTDHAAAVAGKDETIARLRKALEAARVIAKGPSVRAYHGIAPEDQCRLESLIAAALQEPPHAE